MMKKIPLTQEQFAIVDNEDFDWLNSFKWYASYHPQIKGFYAQRNVRNNGGKQHKVLMHRLILGLAEGDGVVTDHKNHNSLDNRESNLRAGNHSQNACNRKSVRGGNWVEKRQKWQAAIKKNSKQRWLGYFNTEEEARQAYLKAKQERDSLIEIMV